MRLKHLILLLKNLFHRLAKMQPQHQGRQDSLRTRDLITTWGGQFRNQELPEKQIHQEQVAQVMLLVLKIGVKVPLLEKETMIGVVNQEKGGGVIADLEDGAMKGEGPLKETHHVIDGNGERDQDLVQAEGGNVIPDKTQGVL